MSKALEDYTSRPDVIEVTRLACIARMLRCHAEGKSFWLTNTSEPIPPGTDPSMRDKVFAAQWAALQQDFDRRGGRE